jgi:hypothetical protein
MTALRSVGDNELRRAEISILLFIIPRTSQTKKNDKNNPVQACSSIPLSTRNTTVMLKKSCT